ncbi:MAG: lipopolysaccharide transport periplasmic protein LptA [Deltaproteobacteria bacterium]|nr:MAG: lipopolysaccharide transport periplasmic protein LptA [Deltaproteobacteria bacterium]
MIRRFLVLLAGLAVLAPAMSAMAAESASPSFDRNAPLEITSDRLEADDNRRQVVFVGQVVGRQDTLTIHCGRLTVEYAEGRQVRRIIALEDVRIIQGDRVATGEQAVYDRQSGSIVLTGNPRVNQGEDFVSGEKITVYLDDRRSLVEGGKQGRVKALFHPGEKGDGSNPAR